MSHSTLAPSGRHACEPIHKATAGRRKKTTIWLRIPTQQRGSERPLPNRQETGKPGVRDGSLIGPRAVLEARFRQQLLIPAVRYGCGTNVPQYVAGAGPVLVGAGTFIVVQHAIGEFDVERRPAGTTLVGWRCNLMDHLVLRIIRRHQEV